MSREQTMLEIRGVLESMKFSVCSESLGYGQALTEEFKNAIEQSEKFLLIADSGSENLNQVISYISKTRDNQSTFLYLDTNVLPLSLKFLVGGMNITDSADDMWLKLVYHMFEDEISSLLAEAEDLHIVERNGLYGYADEKDRILIPCQWIDCGIFSEGLAPVQLADDMWGYIDTQGRLAIPYKLKKARPFMQGYGVAVVQNRMGKWVYMDKDGTMDKSDDTGVFAQLSPEGMEENYRISMEIEEDLKKAGIK